VTTEAGNSPPRKSSCFSYPVTEKKPKPPLLKAWLSYTKGGKKKNQTKTPSPGGNRAQYCETELLILPSSLHF